MTDARRRRAPRRPAPTREVEESLWALGHELVVGIDEVGRGAWAGPLMVGAALLPRDSQVLGVRDSKQLSETAREVLFDQVAHWCTTWSIGEATHDECDELGMAEAQRLATGRALARLGVRPDAAVVDGKWDFVGNLVPHVEMRVGADATCLSVAAASILAKVTRDRMMRAYAEDLPQWHFATNKGYPCPLHRTALAGHGPSAIHRRSWVFIERYLPWSGLRTTPGGQRSLFQ